jgi:hypothetical protein
MARNWKLIGSKPIIIIILHEISDVSHTHESLITGLVRSVCVPRMDKGREVTRWEPMQAVAGPTKPLGSQRKLGGAGCQLLCRQ